MLTRDNKASRDANALEKIANALQRARHLAARGDDDAAKGAYLEVLQINQLHRDALTELGALARTSGHLTAARAAFGQAVQYHPGDSQAQVGYATVLNEMGDATAARAHFNAALRIDPELPAAHQGLACLLTEIGENAEEHWRKGFLGHAVMRRRYRGSGAGTPLLLLVAAVGGNIAIQHWIDDRAFAVTSVFADFLDPDDPKALNPVPADAVIVNAIGDADLCETALATAERIVTQRGSARVINAPASVRNTGRQAIARRLTDIPDVVVPRMGRLSESRGLQFPLLLRAPGYHTGQHFVRVETNDALPAAAAALPNGDPLWIEYRDARGPDGMARKYRVMFIGGALYPLHLAISADWKVHYFTAPMAANMDFRNEEQRFLNDMPGVLGDRAIAALKAIQAEIGLDYGGIDFAPRPDGSLLVFEANATMAIFPPDTDPMWDYRRQALTAALAAARRLLAPQNELAA